jgi:hypothetical protein
MSTPHPGYDEIILTAPASVQLCNSLGCARQGRAAGVIVAYGTLEDPGASMYDRASLWPESWGRSFPMCPPCWDQTRQFVATCRPALAIHDHTASAAPRPPIGRT